jgi:hypothetical protein
VFSHIEYVLSPFVCVCCMLPLFLTHSLPPPPPPPLIQDPKPGDVHRVGFARTMKGTSGNEEEDTYIYIIRSQRLRFREYTTIYQSKLLERQHG